MMEGFSPAPSPRIFWNSRKRPASGRSSERVMDEERPKTPPSTTRSKHSKEEGAKPASGHQSSPVAAAPALSERRRALFEPLQPPAGSRTPAEVLLPPPDFEATSYPKGWLVGKRRKLVNVDVVESMRRIAVQEMNRKDREIDELNEQLEEDARCLEHLQIQLIEERNKRADAERQKAVLQEQVSMLMNMLEGEAEAEAETETDHAEGAPDQEH